MKIQATSDCVRIHWNDTLGQRSEATIPVSEFRSLLEQAQVLKLVFS